MTSPFLLSFFWLFLALDRLLACLIGCLALALPLFFCFIVCCSIAVFSGESVKIAHFLLLLLADLVFLGGALGKGLTHSGDKVLSCE